MNKVINPQKAEQCQQIKLSQTSSKCFPRPFKYFEVLANRANLKFGKVRKCLGSQS